MPRCGVEARSIDDLGAEAASPLHGRIEIVHLEPQHDAVSRRCGVRIDEIGMILCVPRVQLQKQFAGAGDPVIEVAMLVVWQGVSCQQLGVPATAGPDIAHRYEGLRLDHPAKIR